ncbi:probable ubiquitin carboxyl-terminal hydrolase 8 isoform X2 [Mizuhopecten yessoensis]|uniref:probable ubiquitin carboxyl-terminal hydrolase 8 isoform X2 n=1 Tax=Mizuhopecten yessoensis TaxID=6573 RepID=UPI000B45CD5F|nr:probable ubiquitin carboxyl-terminal hydrolase 8 isoform X2 [Mizuhopecten yessoensis]
MSVHRIFNYCFVFLLPAQHFSTERAESRKQLDMKILSKKNEITGLQNTKLTCAVNAVVQVLAQTPGFSETIYEFGGKCKQEAVLANVLINSITDVNNASGIINAEGLQEEMITRRNSFHFWRQHDCLSFLLFLLEALEEELGNDSMKLFTGQMRNRFKYDNCEHTEHSSLQNFKSLCIPMNNSENSVEKYLKMLFRAENLIDSGMYCRSCGKASRKLLKHDICSKELLIEESPQILVLQLAKFEEVKDIYGHTKLDKRHVPMLYSDTLQLQEGESPSRVKYELFAIISHLGTIEGGHYVSYVQTIQSQRECARFDRHDRRSSTWYHCTDSVVTRLEPEAGYPTCPNAYILFYHKQPRK